MNFLIIFLLVIYTTGIFGGATEQCLTLVESQNSLEVDCNNPKADGCSSFKDVLEWHSTNSWKHMFHVKMKNCPSNSNESTSFASVPNLQRIDLSNNNQIGFLADDAFTNLTDLEYVNLNGIRCHRIDMFRNNKQIRRLLIADTTLLDFEFDMLDAQRGKLELLDVSFNNLVNLHRPEMHLKLFPIYRPPFSVWIFRAILLGKFPSKYSNVWRTCKH